MKDTKLNSYCRLTIFTVFKFPDIPIIFQKSLFYKPILFDFEQLFTMIMHESKRPYNKNKQRGGGQYQEYWCWK